MTDRRGDAALARYYDRLSAYVAAARLWGKGGGRAAFSVHRALARPESGERASPERLDALLIELLGPLDRPTVLDAGCGFGGTIFRLAERFGGEYDGVTLSASQVRVATKEAARRGLSRTCRFVVSGYDDPLPRTYDLIVAIESLAHSRDIGRTLANLAGALKPGGRLVAVDDVPAEGLAESDADLRAFRRGWRVFALPTADEYRRASAGAGLTLEWERDLTAWTPRRSASGIALLTGLNRLAGALLPFAAAQELTASYLGGLALERLYARGQMRYVAIAARGARSDRQAAGAAVDLLGGVEHSQALGRASRRGHQNI